MQAKEIKKSSWTEGKLLWGNCVKWINICQEEKLVKSLLSRENELQGESVVLHSIMKDIWIQLEYRTGEGSEWAEATYCRASWTSQRSFYCSAQAPARAQVSFQHSPFLLDCRPPEHASVPSFESCRHPPSLLNLQSGALKLPASLFPVRQHAAFWVKNFQY